MMLQMVVMLREMKQNLSDAGADNGEVEREFRV